MPPLCTLCVLRALPRRTPWAVRSAAASGNLLARLWPRGGKMDDITVVVALVAR